MKECKQEYIAWINENQWEEGSEGSKLFDEAEMEGEVKEDKEVDANGKLLEALKSNEDIPIQVLHEKPPKESHAVSGKAIILVGISYDDEINKDTQLP